MHEGIAIVHAVIKAETSYQMGLFRGDLANGFVDHASVIAVDDAIEVEIVHPAVAIDVDKKISGISIKVAAVTGAAADGLEQTVDGRYG